MNATDPSARRRLVLGGLALPLLAACGGGDDDDKGTTVLRTLNLTSDLSSLELDVEDVRRFQGVAVDAISAAQSFEAETYTLKVRRSGSETALYSADHQLSKDTAYTAVIWGRESSLRLATLPESESIDDVSSGNARVRFYNATVDSGALDIYVGNASTALDEATPTQGALTPGGLSSWRDVTAGTWRLRVTGNADTGDLRLDIPEVRLGDRTHVTVILTAGPGGVLVHGVTLVQQGALTVSKNSKARVRVVAGVEGQGAVGVSFGGQTIAGSLRSPSVGPYALVDTGQQSLAMRVGGAEVLRRTESLLPGGDYTLLAYGGGASAPRMAVIADDNRLPSNTGTRCKIRLVHGAEAQGSATLALDYAVSASDVPLGQASVFSSVLAANSVRLDVTSANASQELYTATEVKLTAGGVYTVFLLGGNSTPAGVVRRDR